MLEPSEGVSKPKPLQENSAGFWSRRFGELLLLTSCTEQTEWNCTIPFFVTYVFTTSDGDDP